MVGNLDMRKACPMTIDAIRSIDRELDGAAGPGHPASNLKAGVLSVDQIAITADDGHMFISDGTNHWESQYQGKVSGVEQWLPRWVDLITRRNQTAGEADIQLVHFIIPEKQVVLPHIRWPDSQETGENRPMLQLLAALQAEPDVIYAEAAMRAALANGPTHHRHDSHWNASGCLAAMRPLLERIAPQIKIELIGFNAALENGSLDLSEHFFSTPPTEEYLFLMPNGRVVADNQHVAKTGKHVGSFYSLLNEKAPDPRKVLVLGDSYSYAKGVTFVLSALFRRVSFVWIKTIPWDLVFREKPDIIIWEHAERYMISIPPS